MILFKNICILVRKKLPQCYSHSSPSLKARGFLAVFYKLIRNPAKVKNNVIYRFFSVFLNYYRTISV